MKSSIVLEYYKVLNKVTMNRFNDFVDSPYFTKHLPTKKLHDHLIKESRKEKNQNFDKRVMFKKIFSDEKYNEQKLKNIISSLLDLFENFLAIEALKKDKASHNLLYLNEALNVKAIRNTGRFINAAFKEKNTLDINYSKKYYYNYQLCDYAYTYEAYQGNRVSSANQLQESAHNLDKFYFAEKMLIGATVYNRKKILSSDLSENLYDEIEVLISNKIELFENDKIIHLNHQLYLLQKSDEEKYYFVLKKMVLNTKLIESERRVYYSFLNNYCIRMINSGKQEYLKEFFEINQKIIENKIHLENNIMSEWYFMNIVNTGLRLKEFQWTEIFIEEQSKFLNQRSYLNAYSYNLANLAYYKKEFETAFTNLLEVEYTDVFYILSSKALLLKIYYETKEYEALDSLLHSFRLLTMRQAKISTKQKKAYLNLIKISNLILSLTLKKMTYKKNKLKTEIEKIKDKIAIYKDLANKTWLLEKLDEI